MNEAETKVEWTHCLLKNGKMDAVLFSADQLVLRSQTTFFFYIGINPNIKEKSGLYKRYIMVSVVSVVSMDTRIWISIYILLMYMPSQRARQWKHTKFVEKCVQATMHECSSYKPKMGRVLFV